MTLGNIMKALIVLLACLSCATSLDTASQISNSSLQPRVLQPAPFICRQIGVFVDPLSCQHFYRCKRTLFGAFKLDYFKCPLDMYFSTAYQRCVIATQSDCLATSLAPTPPTTTTIRPPSFICVQQGRFINPLDPTCKLYYNCVMGANGQFNVGLYSCPGSTYFSYVYQRCVEAIYSDCLINPPVAPSTTPAPPLYPCVQSGMFADPDDTTCRIYFHCVMRANGEFNVARYVCPGSTYFSTTYQRCVEAIETECLAKPPGPVTPVPAPPFSSDQPAPTPGFPGGLSRRVNDFQANDFETRAALAEFVCDKQGKFRDTQDLSCKLYYDCETISDGTFSAIRYSCPDSTLFSDDQQNCVQASKSDCSTIYSNNSNTIQLFISNTSYPANFSPELLLRESISQSTTDSPQFVCEKEGRFKDQDDLTCQLYFLCVIGDDGEFNLGHYNCPEPTLFSSRYGRCVAASSSECEPISTTTVTPSPTTTKSPETQPTTNSETTTPQIPEFKCTSEGRFKDEEDLTCQWYYLCVISEDGVMQKGHYACPGTTHFNNNYRRCMEASTSECVPATTTTENPAITSVETEAPTTHEPTNPPSTSKPSTDGTTTSPAQFECSEEGRFKDEQDFTCKKYYLCVIGDNGKFNLGHYSCPENTLFSSKYGRCVEASKSECIPLTTTTETPSLPPETQPTSTTDGPTPEFVCTSEGRFKDEEDLSCKWYYLCVLDEDGTMQKGYYSCPGTTLFNANYRRCMEASKSECIPVTTSTESPTTITQTVPTNAQTDAPTTVTQTVPSTSAETDAPTTVSQTEATTSTDEPTSSAPQFVCSEEGRFKDENDFTCKKYYLCVIGDNGEFNLGHYSCPGTTLFSSKYRRCVEASTSECEPLTTTTEGSSIATDPHPTSTTDSPTNAPPEFVCTSEGRFKDDQDLTCKWYYLCVISEDGTMQKGHYACPGDTLFNSNYKRCMEASKSECVPVTTTTEVASTNPPTDQPTTSKPTDPPTTSQTTDLPTTSQPTDLPTTSQPTDLPTTSQPTDLPTTSQPTDLPTTSQPTDLPTTSQPTDLPTTSQPTDLPTTSQPTDLPTTSQPTDPPTSSPPQFECTKEGRFKDELDLTCKKYYLCVIGDDGEFNLGHYSCPGPTLFSAKYGRCVDASTSECEPITTSTEGPTTPETQPTSTTDKPTTSPPEFVCTSEGRFKDEEDLTCKWYYLCVIAEDGSMQKGHYACPGDTLFNPNYKRCMEASKSECVPVTTTSTVAPTTSYPTEIPTNLPTDAPTDAPTDVSTTNIPTTNSPTEVPTDIPVTNSTNSPTTSTPEFVCTEEGRFKDEQDLTCKKYYLCVIGDNGGFDLGHYSCPGTTLFSTRYGRCVQASTSECEPITTSTEGPTTPETQPTSTTDKPTTSPPEFVCTSEGRFKDEQDLTCKWYYLCVIGEDGSMQKGHYSCPGDSLFNSNYKRCMDPSNAECVPITTTTAIPTTQETPEPTTSAPITTEVPTEAPTSTDKPTQPPITTTTESGPTCVIQGTFPDPTMPHCEGYYKCVQAGADLVKINYKCPNGTVFHLQLKYCVPDNTYTCPV